MKTFLYAIVFLTLLLPSLTGATEAPFEVRELYAPAHFGNGYECMGEYEMLDTLKEAQFWGFNSYGDWFDMLDCADIATTKRQFDLADALWFQKKANFHSAQRIGLPRSFLLTPNHVYLNQSSQKDIQAVMGGHVFGQLVCPSNPKGREIILKDYEYLFSDAKAAGIRFTSMESGPYDYGGCNCEKCKPWILTYAKLAHDIHKMAEKYHPGIKNDMIGWWWKPEEHRLFAEWCDKNAPGWVRNMYLHIPYGKTTVSNVPLPKGCKRGAFVHIGYADKAQPKDVYGHWGPVVAANRLEKTLIDLKKQGVTVLTAYSEGQSDDVNKALYAGLASGKYKTADEVLEAYAARYFGTDAETSKQWAAWIKAWGSPFSRDTEESQGRTRNITSQHPEQRLLALPPMGPQSRPDRTPSADHGRQGMDPRTTGPRRPILANPRKDPPRPLGPWPPTSHLRPILVRRGLVRVMGEACRGGAEEAD